MLDGVYRPAESKPVFVPARAPTDDELRAVLLAAVGRATSSGNQTTLYLTPMHAQAGPIKSMVANVHAANQHVKAAAAQLPKLDRWRALLGYICQCIVGQIDRPIPPPALAAPG